VQFYDNSKLTRCKGEVRLLSESGQEISLGAFSDQQSKNKVQHGESAFQHCCQIERAMSGVSLALPTFPVIIGRRPQSLVKDAENLGTPKGQGSFNNYLSAAQTPLRPPTIKMPSFSYSQPSTSPLALHPLTNLQKPTEFTKKIFIPQIGHVVHYTNGLVDIFYLDNSKITVLGPQQGNGILFTPSGLNKQATHYREDDLMPGEVARKFKQIPNVLKQMMELGQNQLVSSTPVVRGVNFVRHFR
jgi:hypothetical protein